MFLLPSKYKLTVKLGHELTLTDFYMSDDDNPNFADACKWAEYSLNKWQNKYCKDGESFDSITLTCQRRY